MSAGATHLVEDSAPATRGRLVPAALRLGAGVTLAGVVLALMGTVFVASVVAFAWLCEIGILAASIAWGS